MRAKTLRKYPYDQSDANLPVLGCYRLSAGGEDNATPINEN